MRRKIIKIIKNCGDKNEPCFLNKIAAKVGLTHVAVKNHLDLLIEEGYVKILNPRGKPHYLKLTKKGESIYLELTS